MKKSIVFLFLGLAIVLGSVAALIYERPLLCTTDQKQAAYCIQSTASTTPFLVGVPSAYAFSILDNQGDTVKKFEVTHTKQMHMIVVRKDLESFQHLHPEFNEETGEFTLPDLTFPTAGEYRVFADFLPSGTSEEPVTISEDIVVGERSQYTPVTLGDEKTTDTVDGITVTLTSNQPFVATEHMLLSLDIQENGQPVTDLQPYLGALAHTVILREDSLDFIHAHPVQDANDQQNGQVSFMVTAPSAGNYKLFTQIQRNGKISLATFVVSFAHGGAGGTEVEHHPRGGAELLYHHLEGEQLVPLEK